MLRLPCVSASRAHCTWRDNTWIRNSSARYISVPTLAYKSMLSEKRKRERGCKKRIELSAMAKRYISDAIVIGEYRAAFSILRACRVPARENLRAGEKLCVSNYAIR